MAGTDRDYSGLALGGPRWRRDLTTDAANAGYPDLIHVPAGAEVMSILPTTNALEVLDEGVTASTSLSASLLASTASGTAIADQWSSFPVENGSVIAIFGATVGTVYEVGFYVRSAEKR